MKLPPITIITTTWAPKGEVGDRRGATARICITSWFLYLRYEGQVRLHVADDGSDNEEFYGPEAFLPYRLPQNEVSFSRQMRQGVGASLNAGIGAAMKNSPLLAYIVDDWRLMAPLDLTPWARLLLEEEYLGAIRLGPPHPDLTGIIRHFHGTWAMVLDRHHFAFSHRPTLFHERFFQAYGLQEEGINAMECEQRYNEMFVGTPGPEIAYAISYPWDHIGQDELGDIRPQEVSKSSA